MNLAAVLATGLFAGGVSCAAVQGGLLAGLVARQRPAPAPGTGTPGRPASTTSTAGRATAGPAGADAAAGSARGRLVDDLVPVGGFLAGKLVSHTLLGAALGAVGAAVQLSVGLRTTAQIVAGVLIIVFGLAQLGVPGFRGITVTPPASWGRFVRGRARSQSVLAPALLGLVSVLIPCGVTLSVQALALTSGSPWAGAATMAVFVAGTAPLFTVLGYAARKAATAWRGRLAAATGLVVLGVGAYTLNGGLELAGSPFAASRVAEAAGLGPAPITTFAPEDAPPVSTDGGRQTVIVTARTGYYRPANLQIAAGVPTTLIVRSAGAEGCVRSFIIRDRQYILPVRGDTSIDLGTLTPGRLRYSCGMGMYTGSLTIA
ncbi:sulfite exporter TauE/SafE family protein [Dactylosporangium sp. NPDC051484]|uniref:sulfite exporter TauE/SafE family protein n=1 Tax=Dactylosporangium sp. NPDC051484 TaxID=3154942 RepID=UPI00344E97C2